jgi:hypothetical protein
MTNVQQPEMRRSETNPMVQDSKEPGPGRPGARGGQARPVPPDQVSSHGPAPRPVAAPGGAGEHDDNEPEAARR